MNRTRLSRTLVRWCSASASGPAHTASSSWRTRHVRLLAQRRTKEPTQTATVALWCWRKEWAWTTNTIGLSTTCQSPGVTRFKTTDSTAQQGSRWVVSWEIRRTPNMTIRVHWTQRTTSQEPITHSTTSTCSSHITAALKKNGEMRSSKTEVALCQLKLHRRPSATIPTALTATANSHWRFRPRLWRLERLLISCTRTRLNSSKTTPSSGAHDGTTFSSQCLTPTFSGSVSWTPSWSSCFCLEWWPWSCWERCTRISPATIKWILVKMLRKNSVSWKLFKVLTNET